MKAPVIDKMDVMFVENNTAVNVCIFNVSSYQQENLFVRIDQIEDLNIPLGDVNMSYVTSLRTLFRVHVLYYLRGTLSVTFQRRVSAADMTTLSIDGMTAGHQVLNSRTKVFCLDGRHHMEVIRQ